MDQIQELITHISPQTIQDFFVRKISSFRPQKEDLDHLLSGKDAYFSKLSKLGEAYYENSDGLLVFSCRYTGELTDRSSKKKQFDIAKKVLREDFKDGAIFVFYDDSGAFRFSFIRKNYGDEEKKYTPWRRFTYFIDPAKNNKTFIRRLGNCLFDSLGGIRDAFSVEPLSKQFYKELSCWYFWSLSQVKFPNDIKLDRHTLHTNAMIRMITRIIFVWFMKQKNLVPDDFFDKEKLDELLKYKDSTGSTYYKAILQNLFFATLNTPKEKGRIFVSRQYGIQNFFRYKRYIKDEVRFKELMGQIPFLNGGLFENLDEVKPDENIDKRVDCFSDNKKNESRLKVPDYLFFGQRHADLRNYLGNSYQKVQVNGLIDILNQYDFTIDENTPFDQEVALDPELLGMVFENLLASYNPETETLARNESGSFYTPREVVDFMVEESLLQYLQRQGDLSSDKLRALFNNTEEQPFTGSKDRKKIINLLSEVKIIDPACGSGAFPMGALQKMVHILSKIDVDNHLWRERQKEIAIEETKAAYDIGDTEERRMRLENIERAFEQGLNDPDYARKLFLIENCLYGVDIQPIAMQISKLRFFISLLVEQKVTRDKSNFGILALPNLETRFVAANTLKGLPGSRRDDPFLKDIRIEDLEKELNQLRHELFSARTPKTKEKKRNRYKAIQVEIGKLLIDNGFPDEMANAIQSWQAFNANFAADWFDPEWMFGNSHFDIVIGNPPYIQLQKAFPGSSKLKYADLYKDEKYQTFERTGDIYALFYERGTDLLRQDGVLCYITSNKWMRAHYGETLRKFFAENTNPILLIDFAGQRIFESATVDTNILLFSRGKNKSNTRTCIVKENALNNLSAYVKQESAITNFNANDSWVILSPIERRIKEKIEKIGTPLKDWDISIYRGVLTGYNEAFIITGEQRKELIRQDRKSDEIIRPILRGRDIKRYGYSFADLYLITTFPSLNIDIEKYPAVKQHLLSFGKRRLEQSGAKGSRKKTNNKWFETQDSINYWEDFSKQKIIYPGIMRISKNNMDNFPRFALDKNMHFYFGNDCYFIVGNNLDYLWLLLNSTLLGYLFRYYIYSFDETGFKIFTDYFRNIPLPIPNKKRLSDAKHLLNGQIKISSINNWIYELMNFTISEVKEVEDSVGSLLKVNEFL